MSRYGSRGDELSPRYRMLRAVVTGRNGTEVMLAAGATAAMLPDYGRIPGERLNPGQEVAVVALRAAENQPMVVSRAHPALLARLLEEEVPDVGSSVTIKRVVRDAGVLAKVAVAPTNGAGDPVSIVRGPGGAHVQAVQAQLGRERVDIVAWAEEPAAFIRNALDLPETIPVHLDEETRTAQVVVPSRTVRAVKGPRNSNARMATYLTRWKVVVEPDVPMPREPRPSGPPGRRPDSRFSGPPPRRPFGGDGPRSFSEPERQAFGGPRPAPGGRSDLASGGRPDLAPSRPEAPAAGATRTDGLTTRLYPSTTGPTRAGGLTMRPWTPPTAGVPPILTPRVPGTAALPQSVEAPAEPVRRTVRRARTTTPADEKPALRVELTPRSSLPPPPAPPPAPATKRKNDDWDELECVEAVGKVIEHLGYKPSPGQYQTVRASGVLGDLPSPATIVHRVGDWDDAVDLASLMPEEEEQQS